MISSNPSFKRDALDARPLIQTLGFTMDANYKKILDRALSESDEFSLVWRHEFKFKKSAFLIHEKLLAFLVSEYMTSSWPGTELIGGVATLRKYKLTEQSLSTLHTVNNVFDWLAPKYPEDLAFYKNGKVVFTSIAHEKEAWFD